MNNEIYINKYLKYKTKYMDLKENQAIDDKINMNLKENQDIDSKVGGKVKPQGIIRTAKSISNIIPKDEVKQMVKGRIQDTARNAKDRIQDKAKKAKDKIQDQVVNPRKRDANGDCEPCEPCKSGCIIS